LKIVQEALVRVGIHVMALGLLEVGELELCEDSMGYPYIALLYEKKRTP
jgi:hypothetical protein